MSEQQLYQLSVAEILAIEGVGFQEAEIENKYVKPLKQKWDALVKEIENRLGLEEGAIGTTHIIEANSGKVVKLPQKQEQEGDLESK